MTNRNLVSIHDLHVAFDSELGTTEALKGMILTSNMGERLRLLASLARENLLQR